MSQTAAEIARLLATHPWPDMPADTMTAADWEDVAEVVEGVVEAKLRDAREQLVRELAYGARATTRARKLEEAAKRVAAHVRSLPTPQRTCPHVDRRHYAHGLCASCYKRRNRMEKRDGLPSHS